MIDLVLSEAHLSEVRAELLVGEVESCAVLFASCVRCSDDSIRLLVQDREVPRPTDYVRRGVLEAELSPDFVARLTKRARREGRSLIFAHSHPGTAAPLFSDVDAMGEERLADFLAHRLPNVTHAALVFSSGGVRARQLGTSQEARIVSVGTTRDVLFDSLDHQEDGEVFDRQVRAFGSRGQTALRSLRVAVVGVGGTGSIVVQELVHLGVRDFIVVDPDLIEQTNLNRVAGASPPDLGAPKVEIARRHVRSIGGSGVAIKAIQGDIIRSDIAKELLSADVIFGCTDSHGSRAVLQQLAYQYLIPCIDLGTTIVVENRQIRHVIGRVQLLSPGLACLTCSRLLDSNLVRQDMMTAFERQTDPYIQGLREPAPAVMSINGTVASLAVTMLLAVVAGVPSRGRHVIYDALAPSLRSVKTTPEPGCFVCSTSGALARGDEWPLMARTD